MTALEIAKKFANKIVRINLTKSSSVYDHNNKPATSFEGRIVGYKRATGSDPEFVAVEVLKPHKTKFALKDFRAGYYWTVLNRNLSGYAKKVYPDEIVIPSITPTSTYQPKDVPKWPHKCRDCGSPALVLMNSIDCSNDNCKNKYRTNSGLDLFLPKEMRQASHDKVLKGLK